MEYQLRPALQGRDAGQAKRTLNTMWAMVVIAMNKDSPCFSPVISSGIWITSSAPSFASGDETLDFLGQYS
ncbi:hypothetical protein Golomagni_06381 [Golovinomyces magnicellulatus]|nr:hypothetical protein Golomagni_06381 [Golovinomyces magnicellulatus]